MEKRYDPEYSQRLLERIEAKGAEKIFFENFIVKGNENLERKTSNQRIYIANHLSHMDYALTGLQFHRQKIKMPMIPAGANLDLKFLKMLGLDFGKLGAYFIDRDLMDQNTQHATNHKKEIIRATKQLIREGLDLHVFPEGGRSYSGILFKEYNIGIIRAAISENQNVDIVPIAFAYDHRPEEKFLNIIAKGNRKTLIGKILYYLPDGYAHFINRPIARTLGFRVGNAYMSIGTPKHLSEISPNQRCRHKAIKEYSIQEINKLYEEVKK